MKTLFKIQDPTNSPEHSKCRIELGRCLKRFSDRISCRFTRELGIRVLARKIQLAIFARLPSLHTVRVTCLIGAQCGLGHGCYGDFFAPKLSNSIQPSALFTVAPTHVSAAFFALILAASAFSNFTAFAFLRMEAGVDVASTAEGAGPGRLARTLTSLAQLTKCNGKLQ